LVSIERREKCCGWCFGHREEKGMWKSISEIFPAITFGAQGEVVAVHLTIICQLYLKEKGERKREREGSMPAFALAGFLFLRWRLPETKARLSRTSRSPWRRGGKRGGKEKERTAATVADSFADARPFLSRAPGRVISSGSTPTTQEGGGKGNREEFFDLGGRGSREDRNHTTGGEGGGKKRTHRQGNWTVIFAGGGEKKGEKGVRGANLLITLSHCGLSPSSRGEEGGKKKRKEKTFSMERRLALPLPSAPR